MGCVKLAPFLCFDVTVLNLKVFLLKPLSTLILIWLILHLSLVPEGNQRFTPKHVITVFIVIVHL